MLLLSWRACSQSPRLAWYPGPQAGTQHSSLSVESQRGPHRARCQVPASPSPFPNPGPRRHPSHFAECGTWAQRALPHCRPPWHWKAALLTPPHPFLAPHPSSAAGGTEERRSYSSAEPVSLGRELLSAALLVLAPPDSRVSQEGPPPQGGSSSPGDEESQRVGRLCVPVYSGTVVPLGQTVTLQCHSRSPLKRFRLFKTDGKRRLPELQGHHFNNFTLGPVTGEHAGSYIRSEAYWSIPSDPLQIVVSGRRGPAQPGTAMPAGNPSLGPRPSASPKRVSGT